MTTLPRHFCWTRFGTEAGEPIGAILARKELERQRNEGVFLWGIGNAIGPSMRELIRVESAPEVVFSPMLTHPKQADVSPHTIATWRSARGLDGVEVPLPKSSVVTSRAPSGARGARHYALVCFSGEPLFFSNEAPSFSVSSLENLLTRRQVGASQVTAIVRYVGVPQCRGATYRLALRARLVEPFFLELSEPELSSHPTGLRPAAVLAAPSLH